MKLSIDHGIQTNYIISMYDTTGILLGFGCLFTWMSVLHYLAYDHVFGLLFSVMERSAFVVLKFLACISILFTGFVLFAWVVLGPYHIKFASWTSTFQSLLSIMHGDEVYVTFTAIDSDKEIISYINTYKKDHRSDLLKFIGRMETKAFDTDACVSCVKRCCPSMLGCMSFCDETNTIENPSN
ncbi:mucolipin-1-like isoform X4 [Mytilus galloprovincialis]|uniref:mucolipin-1-like isoform X3 n=1 Tax=Mytilus galloprovincialis TaxID=29158 RepID=UPI003F7C6ED5